jgi:hypothetical protein
MGWVSSVAIMLKMLQSCPNRQEGGEPYRNLRCTAMPQGVGHSISCFFSQPPEEHRLYATDCEAAIAREPYLDSTTPIALPLLPERFLLALELHAVERGERPTARDQLGKWPLLGDPPVLEDEDRVGPTDRREPVGDHEGRASLYKRLKALYDARLGRRVEGRGGFVKEQNRGIT